MTSPFSVKTWESFGFFGEPEPGKDYSWIRLQNNLDFIGIENCITSCSVYYSSRFQNTLLIKTYDDTSALWNVSALTFSYFGNTYSIIEVSNRLKIIHLSGVTTSFVSLLMRYQKLPYDCLNDLSQIPTQQIKISRCAQPIPIPSSAFKNEASVDISVPVQITSAVDNCLKGDLVFENQHLLKLSTGWSLDFSDISSLSSTQANGFFIVILTKNNQRYEISFDDSNISFAKKILTVFQNQNPSSEGKIE